MPNGPGLVPVWPDIKAPSGVLMIGLTLVLRDIIQCRLGTAAGLGAIAVGAAIPGFLTPSAIVVTSVAAFLLSKLADLAVYAKDPVV